MKLPSRIQFADEKVKKSFEELENAKGDEKQLYEWLVRAFMSYTNKAPNEVR